MNGQFVMNDKRTAEEILKGYDNLTKSMLYRLSYDKPIKAEYIGESIVAFEHGAVYEVMHVKDEKLGEMVSIRDESGEWYLYSKSFFSDNFQYNAL